MFFSCHDNSGEQNDMFSLVSILYCHKCIASVYLYGVYALTVCNLFIY